jgi:hypothetical protein
MSIFVYIIQNTHIKTSIVHSNTHQCTVYLHCQILLKIFLAIILNVTQCFVTSERCYVNDILLYNSIIGVLFI